MSRILIAGCGYVGARLAALLAADSHEVWGLSRNPSGLPDGVRPFAADLGEAETLSVLPEGLDYVAYTAAADATTDADYKRVYVGGVKSLGRALEQQGQRPERVLFTSSTGVYAQNDGEWVNEDSPAEPASFTGARLLEGERAWRDFEYPVCVLRLGGIYGPGRSRLLEQARRGEGATHSDQPSYVNLIHRDDCARALQHLMFLPDPASAYIGVDCEPAPRHEILAWLASRLEVPVKAVSHEPMVRIRGNKRCDSQRLRDTNFSFLYPTYREGFEQIIGAQSASGPV